MNTGSNYTRKCPACQVEAKLHTGDKHRYYGCVKCGSYFRNEGDIWVPVMKQQVPLEKAISIGMKIKLQGIEYTVISQAEKAITDSIYSWTEFLLYHPQFPIASLSENGGHWQLFIPRHIAIKTNDTLVILAEGSKLQLVYQLPVLSVNPFDSLTALCDFRIDL